MPCDPGVVGRRARRGDGPARHRAVAAVGLVARRAPRRRRDRVALAREVNEAGRRAVVDHPGRFGLLASLPLPDVDAAIAEIAYCCDHLDVDGFVLLTNVDGTYVGDASFEPVFRELDRRRRTRAPAPDVAGVLGAHVVRPAATDARVLLRHHARRGRPRAERHDRAQPRPRAHRPARRRDAAARRRPRRARSRALLAPDVDVLRDLGRLHFDLAGFAVPRQLDALLTLTTLDHLHYGSDFPFTPEPVVAAAAERIDGVDALADALRSNTEQLFPHAHRKDDTMNHEIELGLPRASRCPNPASSTPVFADVVGLVPGEPTQPAPTRGATTPSAHRVIVQPGRANDARCVGFEAVDDAAFDATVARLRRRRASTSPTVTRDASAQGRSDSCAPTAPWGVDVEIVLALGGRADAVRVAAGARRLPHRGRRLRPRRVRHDRVRRVARVPRRRASGFGQSDWLEMEIAAGHRARGALLPLQRAAPHARARRARRSSCRSGCTT